VISGIPAGGQKQPWSGRLTFRGAQRGPATILA
jgi:hypothetical protein